MEAIIIKVTEFGPLLGFKSADEVLRAFHQTKYIAYNYIYFSVKIAISSSLIPKYCATVTWWDCSNISWHWDKISFLTKLGSKKDENHVFEFQNT